MLAGDKSIHQVTIPFINWGFTSGRYDVGWLMINPQHHTINHEHKQRTMDPHGLLFLSFKRGGLEYELNYKFWFFLNLIFTDINT